MRLNFGHVHTVMLGDFAVDAEEDRVVLNRQLGAPNRPT